MMKQLKRLFFAVTLLVASIAFSSEVEAWGPKPTSPNWSGNDSGSNHTYQRQHGHRGGSAGAPLDGGLLALLAGAGAIYVAKRKKKKNAE